MLGSSIKSVSGADLLRSPAASRVGELARADGLFLFHFEHRRGLLLPDAWATSADAAPPEWEAGALHEGKYHSYRHDLLIGSFHPSHRGKWTAHELCHGLVGFAWRPGAAPLFHATAARLAEVAPVALWYFLDEIRARRCPRHQASPALFGAFCPACERAAAEGPVDRDPDEAERRGDAARFVDRELAAVVRTRREKRPIPHLWGTLDLCSDGLAYAEAHGPRLNSEEFDWYCADFAVDGAGRWADLDALEARTVDVLAAIAGARLPPHRSGGRERWIRQDVAWRLLQVRADTDGDARRALDALISGLVDGRIEAAIDGYRQAFAEWLLPSPEDVFAVGYPLAGGFGSSIAQLDEGLRAVLPHTLDLLDDAGLSEIAGRFAADDALERRSLAARFASWLGRTHPGPVADLASYEAAIADARRDPLAALGPGDRLAEGVQVVIADLDVVALAEAVEAGTAVGVATPDGVGVEIAGARPAVSPSAVLVGRDAAGLVVADVAPEVARALLAGEPIGASEAAELAAAGLLVADRWPVD